MTFHRRAGRTLREGWFVAQRTPIALLLLAVLTAGCMEPPGGFKTPVCEQHLPSGKVVKVTQCLLVWGVEHGERHTDQDQFSLEYVATVPQTATVELEKEALEVFELIRTASEQWSFTRASVSAFESVERSGPYQVFAFTRGADGKWSFERHPMKVFNTESGHKPGHS